MNQNSVSNDKLLKIINVQTEVVQQGMNLSNIMDLVTQRTQHITNADGASVELVEKRELVYSATSGIAEKFLGLRLDMENSLSGECIRVGVPLISNDIESDDRVNKNACRQIGLNSMIVVPLIFRNDIVGVIKVLSAKAGHFNDDNIKILELMSGLIAAAMFSAMRNEESELFYKATHDSLTGISNRSVFYDRLRQRLSQALRKHENFGIISLDMDGLKEINDNWGHRAGDAAIKEVALRINSTLRESDTVSRLGGDEFGIIATTAVDRNDLRSLIERIDCEIIKPFEFEDQKINLRASIGYALFSEDGIDLDVLIEKADKSMYEVKRKQKGQGNVR
ncbi:diguanylate cyclase with GAF sensor [Desulfofarcimen acetoxidans DSM 771]|uniref:Diguanylate cyclase with GAF sensor n=1 Tax=Desulfofarcimen acetoxidans (strain ATCC 49208 / DSM 771 / KCTC 5769 / VKM B-1644 / 5575) TaxID=485916 RepID=C8VZM6_DESAS|nr:sensor domain-containing diguanylate cyclase [Desulfofarcimen acetoxidans]ACV63004.1 diguanylate cyclase with GAF sensor [Desulfofarcimen acetoxidans DSM 771]